MSYGRGRERKGDREGERERENEQEESERTLRDFPSSSSLSMWLQCSGQARANRSQAFFRVLTLEYNLSTCTVLCVFLCINGDLIEMEQPRY